MNNIKTKIYPASKEENLLRLFSEAYLKGLEYVSGIEIVEKMGLADDEYLYAVRHRNQNLVHVGNRQIACLFNQYNTPEIVEFFKFFYDALDTNPGEDEASGIWIDNRYGLSPEWRREMKMRSILDS